MTIHFTSDLHIGHARVIEYSHRPFVSVEDMNDQLAANWNAVVKPEDTVYNLGDFSFQRYPDFKQYIQRLNGKIHVILGNHDKMIRQHRQDLLAGGKIVSIQDYLELKVEGQLIVLFHYGLRVWSRSHYGSIMCFGHSHGSLVPHGKSVDVGVDCKEITQEYRPVSLTELLEYMSHRKVAFSDHHGLRGERQ